MNKIFRKFLDFWFQPIDPIRWRLFQQCFAFTFLIYMIERFRYAREWLTDYGFHLDKNTKMWYQVDPAPLMQEWMIPIVAIIVFSSILAVIFQWHARKFVWIVFAWAVYIQLVDNISSFTLNKFYILGFCLIALTPKVKEFYDKTAKKHLMLQSAWPLRVLQFTLLIQYGTAGWCKVIHGDWMSSPDALWTQVQGLYCTDIAAWMLRTIPKGIAWSLMMYSSLAFEVFAPIIFAVRRTRILAYLWGFSFQLVIALTMHQLIYFSAQMVCFYILFMNPDFLKKITGQAKK